MKTKSYFFLIFLLGFTKLYAQEERILTFEFTIGSKEANQSISIRSDSTFISMTIPTTGKYNERFISTNTTLQEWSILLNSISMHKLKEIANLPNPPNAVTPDNAPYSNIKIITGKKEYNCAGFSKYANENLTELMKAILDIEKSKL